MADDTKRLTRPPHHGHHEAADFSELFFDLVYVFAVTQLAHYLLEHHSPLQILQTIVMFLAMWWAWNFTTWASNWLNPVRAPNRLMLFAVMLGSLVMSVSVPRAFEDRALPFALAYVAIQVGRSIYLVMAARKERPALAKGMLPSVYYFAGTGLLWIGGAFVQPETRLWVWGAAVIAEYLLPFVLSTRNHEGGRDLHVFEVTGAHMAERCGLFVIIALGEGIIMTGATFARQEWDGAAIAAFLIAFLGSVTMWWIYFDVGARRGSAAIAEHEESGRIARDAYTFAHVPIIAGVILTAMADELLLAHPTGHSEPALIASTYGAMALFLGGTMLFKRITGGMPWWPLSHLVGLGLLVLGAAWAWLAHPEPLVTVGVALAIMLVVAIWEWGSLHGGWVERGMPQPAPLRRRGEKPMERYERLQSEKKSVPPKDD